MQSQFNSANHLLFVDPSVDNYLSLLRDLNTNTEVFLLDGLTDGMQQITNILASKENLQSIQILSHGLQAQLHLGNGQLNIENLQDYSEQLSLWGKALGFRGDILLYGCNVAEGRIGQSFIAELSRLTGANVAASDDLTGNSNLGGDWDLEFHVGNITARSVLSEEAKKSFAGVLNTNITGLNAVFYADDGFRGNRLTFIDDRITEDWREGNHGVSGEDNEFFSATWSGYFVPPVSGNYSFKLRADDWHRLTIDGKALGSRSSGFAEKLSEVVYRPGNNGYYDKNTVHPISVDFEEERGSAAIWFSVAPPGTSEYYHELSQYFSPYYPPTISITPDNSYVNNGNEGHFARFKISADRTADRDIYLKYDNNIFQNGATGDDAGYYPNTIRLPAGQQEAFFEIPLNSDDRAEEASGEQIKITLQESHPSYLLANNTSAAINIKDVPVVNIIDSRQAEEGKANGAFILDFNNPTTRNFDLQFQLSGDAKVNTTTSPTAGTDYNLSYIAQNANGQDIGRVTVSNTNNTYKINVPAGAKRILVNVEPINDEIAETEYENVNLQLFNPSSDNQTYRVGNNSSSNVWVVDNEPTVSLGKVVMPQEGFGYGSTIQDLGSALEVNGSSHISIADNDKLNLSKTGQFTQEAWIFASINDNRKRGILGYQTSANDPQTYPSIWQQGNNIQVGFGDGQKFQSFTASNVLNQNTWNHVATTFDGQKYRLYVNGVEVYVDERWQGSKLPNTQQLTIGKVDNNFFAGTIDEVRIWNVARSAGDIQNAMLTPLSGSEQGLVGYWQFENNLNDLSNQGSAISQTPANGVFNGGVQYINNPSPQIGYIEVNLNKPFTGPQGLWVKYNLSGNAGQNVDYFNSRYRRLSNDPNSERDGIIIPQGQTSGRIYLIAKPDQIDEPDENITVNLVPRNFDQETASSVTNSNYWVNNASSTRTVNIKNNPAYKSGFILLDKYNRLIHANNPVYVDPNGNATVQVKLSSEPAVDTAINIQGNQLTFAKNNWDQLQTINLKGLANNTPLNISFNGSNSPVPVTNNPPQLLQTTEGSTTDIIPIIPQVSIVAASNATEGNTQPATYVINLNAPAPAPGITINYQLSGTAKINEDYTVPGDSNNLSVFVSAGTTSVVLPITAVDDLAKEGTEDVIVTLKTGTGYTLIPNNNQQTASVNIIDNEQIAINIVNASISDEATNTFAYSSNYNPVLLSETGGVEYLGVRLESKPTSNVTLSLVSSNTSEGDVTPANLVFSPDDWNKYQNVTVSAKPDTIYDGDISYQIKVKATSQDSYYQNQTINLAAKTIDDETKPTDNSTIPTITDPSQLPIASISLIQAPTEKETGKIQIKLSEAVAAGSEPVIVLLEATDGSAILNTDYYFPGQNAFIHGPSTTVNNLKIGADSQITLGDLDQDGDLDIVEGTANGEIKYHENVGDGNFQEKLGTNNPFRHVKLTGKIAPTLADLNGDQKLDLLIKDSQGQIHYQINKSDANNSIFLNTVNYQKPINANTTETLYQTIFSVRSDNSSFNPTTVKIADQVLPVKNLRENKETGSYYFDVETTDAKLAETLGTINYNANQLIFDGENTVKTIIGQSEVAKTETIKQNTAIAPTTTTNINLANPFSGINTTHNITLTDLNQDGKLDLILVEKNGDVVYRLNKGTTQQPDFNTANITTDVNLGTGEHFAPTVADMDQDQDLDLVFGTAEGSFKFVENTATKAGEIKFRLNQEKNPLKSVSVAGGNSSVNFTDLDGDGDQDALLSGKTGVVSNYRQVQFVEFLPGESVKEITITPIDDQIDEKDQEDVKINLYPNQGYRLASTDAKATEELKNHPASINLQIADDDQVGLTVKAAQTIISTDESGKTILEYTVKLNSQPLYPVVVSFGTNDLTEAKVKTMQDGNLVDFVDLNFTPDNWQTEQKFYIQGIDDQIADGDVPYQLITSTSSADLLYHKLDFERINFTNKNEGDQAELIITKVTDGQAEGRENIYKVKLNSQPVGDVKVIADPINDQIRVNDAGYGDPMTLKFNQDNWNVEQLVRVSALDDNIVEYNHSSEIVFSVATGQTPTFESRAVNNTAAQAIELGEMAGGYEWKNLALTGNDQDWFKFTMPDAGTSQDFVEIAYQTTTANTANTANNDLQVKLYKADTPTVALTLPVETVEGKQKVSLAGLERGEYLVAITSSSQVDYQYNLLVADDDYNYVNLAKTLKPLEAQIQDNDLPTARIVAGPTASEVFGEPSYFAIMLNAPAPQKNGGTGIVVNYEVVGGSATQQTAGGLGDYQTVSEGSIRIAPGEVQNNVVIVPIDDKLTEDLNLKINQVSAGETKDGKTTFNLDIALTKNNSAGAVINRGSILQFGQGVTGQVLGNVTLGQNGTGTISVQVDSANTQLVTSAKNVKLAGETVSVRLKAGDGYQIAPNDQEATLTIQDDDVPGVRIVQVGERTRVGEEQNATFGISLLSEPTAPVTIKLTPGAEIEFVDPAKPGNVSVNKSVFSFDTKETETNNLDISLKSLVKTENADTIALDLQLKTMPVAPVTYRISDANDPAGATKKPLVEFTLNPDGTVKEEVLGTLKKGNWQALQQLVLTNLDRNANNQYKLQIEELDTTGKVVKTMSLPVLETVEKVEKSTTTITIQPQDWYKLQTITVSGSKDGVGEPGIYHTSDIKYEVTSTDTNYDKLFTPDQTVEVVDRFFNPQETAASVKQGLNVLQDSIDNISLPLVGKLDGKNPDVIGGLGNAFSQQIGGQSTLTAATLKQTLENVLKGFGLEAFNVNTSITENDTVVELKVSKQQKYSVPLDTSLGLPSIGIDFNTSGGLDANFNFDLSLTFGLHKQFGFYIDTKKTFVDAGIKLNLDQFKGKGSLGFLQLDFADDPKNPTELAVTFKASLNDIDDIDKKKKAAAKNTPTTRSINPDGSENTEEETGIIEVDPRNQVLEQNYLQNLNSAMGKLANGNSDLEQNTLDREQALSDLVGSQTEMTDQTKSADATESDETDLQTHSLAKGTTNIKLKATDLQDAIEQANSRGTALSLEDLLGSQLTSKKISAMPDENTEAIADTENTDSENLDSTDLESELDSESAEIIDEIDQYVIDEEVIALDEIGNQTIILRKSAQMEATDQETEETTLLGGEIADNLTENTLIDETPALTPLQTRSLQTRADTGAETISRDDLTSKLLKLGLKEINKILPAGQVTFLNNDKKLEVNYQGRTALSNWMKVKDFPDFAIENPIFTYDKVKQTYSFASTIGIGADNFDLSGSLVKETVNNTSELKWRSLNVVNLPIASLAANIPSLKDYFPASGTATLRLAKGNVEVKYNGDINVGEILTKGIGNTSISIPLVTLSNPLFSYIATDDSKQYKFATNDFVVDYQNNLKDGDYAFNATKVPLGDVTAWLESELGLLGIGKAATGTADLSLTPNSKSAKVDGNVNLTQLIKGIAKNPQLPLPSLAIADPSITYKSDKDGRSYDFTSSTITANYKTNADNSNYSFSAKKLPVGGLTSWLKNQLGLEELGNLATGTVNIDVSKEGAQDFNKSIAFTGSVDVSSLIKTIANNTELPIPSLNLEDPSISYQGNETAKNYKFVSDSLVVNYTKNLTGADYVFQMEKFPIGGLTSWASERLGIADLKGLATGTVDVSIIQNAANNNTSIKLPGSVDLSKLVKAIAPDAPVPSLALSNVAIDYETTTTGKKYAFTSDTVKVKYESNEANTYKLTAEQLPVGNLATWLADQLGVDTISQFVSGKMNLEIGKTKDGNITNKVSFDGSVDISALIKAVANNPNLAIPSLALNDPSFSYQTTDGNKVYDFTADTIKINYNKKTDGTYTFDAKELPLGNLTSWLEDELGLNDLSQSVTGNLNVGVINNSATDNSKSVGFSGDVNITALIKAIANRDLPVPSFNLTNPLLTYQVTDKGKNYALKSGTVEVKYLPNTDGTYEFSASKLPVGGLSTWLAQELKVKELGNLFTGTLDVSVLNTGEGNTTKSLTFTDNVDVSALLKAIANNPNLEIPALALNKPAITYKVDGDNTSYDFTSSTITAKYEAGKDGAYNLVAKKLPVGGLTSWLESMGVGSIGSVITGTVDVDVVKKSATDIDQSVKVDGTIDAAALIKTIAKNDAIPLPSLSLSNPKISYKSLKDSKVYDLTSDTLSVNYETQTNATGKTSYTFQAKKLGVTGLTSWMETQLGVKNISNFAQGNVDVSVDQSALGDLQTTVKFNGNMDIAALAKAIAQKDLAIDPISLTDPIISYSNINGEKKYSFTAGKTKVNYTLKPDDTYTFTLADLPLGEVSDWLQNALGIADGTKFITGTANGSFSPNAKSISITGSVDLGGLLKGVIKDPNLALPDLSLTDPSFSYETTAKGKVIDFTSTGITMKYVNNTDGTYSLAMTNLPTGEVTKFLESQLKVTGLSTLITGNTNLDIKKTSPIDLDTTVKFDGSVNVSKLLEILAGTNTLSLPAINLSKPSFTYQSNDQGQIYTITSPHDATEPSFTVKYEANNDSTYDLTATLPVGDITDWLSTELNLKNLAGTITGNAEISIKKDTKGTQQSVKFTGSEPIDIGKLVSAIANDPNLVTPDLPLEKPLVSVVTTDKGKVYNFVAGDMKINYQANTDGTYTLEAAKLPVGELVNWAANQLKLQKLNDLVTGTLDLDIVKGDKDISNIVKLEGTLDLAQIIKNLANSSDLPLPSLTLRDPAITYTKAGDKLTYKLDSNTIDFAYDTNINNDLYLLKVSNVPLGGLTSWAETELGLKNISQFVSGDVDLTFKKTSNTESSKALKFTGSLNASALLDAIANTSLPIPSLALTNPEITYTKNVDTTIYNLASETLKVNYTKNINGNYQLAVEKIPVGQLTSWIEKEIGLTDFGNAITGDVNISMAKTGEKNSSNSIEFSGLVNVSTLLNSLAGGGLSLPEVKLSTPKLTRTINDGKTEIKFTSGDSLIQYNKNSDTDYLLKIEKVSLDGITQWAEKELQLTGLGNALAGEISLEFTPDKKTISLNGNVDIGGIIQAIAGQQNISMPSINLLNPSFTFTQGENQKQYVFTSEKLKVDYVLKSDDTFTLEITDLEVGKVVAWANDQLGLNGLNELVTGDLDLSINPDTKKVSIDGNLDISALIKSLAGDKSLPIPSLALTDPQFTYTKGEKGNTYNFTGKDPNDSKIVYAVNYEKYTDGTYLLKVDNFPAGKLTSWLSSTLNIADLQGSITGNIDLSIENNQQQIKFNGDVDLAKLINVISGLSLSELKLPSPSFTYKNTDAKVEYAFTAGDTKINYTEDKKDKTKSIFEAKSIPVGGINKWIADQLGLTNFTDVITGKVDITNSPAESSLKLKGSLNIGKLASIINLSAIPNDLSKTLITDPSFTKKANGDLSFSGKGELILAKDAFGSDFNQIAQLLPGTSVTDKGLQFSGNLTVNKSAKDGFTLDAEVPLLGAIKLGQQNGAWKLLAVEDGDRLTLSDLAVLGTNKEYSFTDLFNYEFKGDANLGLTAKTSIQGSKVFPAFSFELAGNLPLFDYGNQAEASKKGLNLAVNNMQLDAGSFVDNIARPIFETINDVVEPIKPVVKFLNADTKVFSEIGLEKEFNWDKKPGVSLIDIAGTIANNPTFKKNNPKVAEKLATVVNFTKTISDIVDLVDSLAALPKGQTFILDFGSYQIAGIKAASQDQIDDLEKTSNIKTTETPPDPLASLETRAAKEEGKEVKGVLSKLTSIKGLELTLLKKPVNALNLVLGKTADIVKYDVPDLDLLFSFEKGFLLYTPPIIEGLIEASFGLKSDLAVGFDTQGIQQWKKSGYKLSDAYKVLDGFYVDDLSWTEKDAKGKPIDKNELTINASFAAGLAADIFVAAAKLKGGIRGQVGFDLEDVGEKNGTSDGKVRGSEIASGIASLSLFELNGFVEAFLKGEILLGVSWLGLTKTVWSKEFTAKLLEFSLSRPNNGFNQNGKVSTSYIADSLVFLDANLNNILDDNEPVTKTDSNGEYTLNLDLAVYDKNQNGKIDPEEGQIVVLGGIDTSSGATINTQFTSPFGEEMITPLTHLQNYLVDAKLVSDKVAAQKLIGDRLGLTLAGNFDLETFDPLKVIGAEAGALQNTGVDIYLAHIQVENLMAHALAFLQGINPQLNPQDLQKQVNQTLGEIFTSTTGVFDLANSAQLQAVFAKLAPAGTAPNILSMAAQIVADSNRLINDIAQEAEQFNLSLVVSVVAPVKRIALGQLTLLTNQLAAGTITPAEVATQLPLQLKGDNFLVEQVINDERNIRIAVEGILGEGKTDSPAEIVITLGEASPPQGMTLIYTLAGTATLGQDYTIKTASPGFIYVEPGASEVKLPIKLIDDNLSEGKESITVNLRYGSESYQIMPDASAIAVDIADNEAPLSNEQTTGLITNGTIEEDSLVGTERNDTISGSYSHDLLQGLAGNDLLQGDYGNDILVGADGADILKGSFGNDSLQGNTGNDLLLGGAGDDTLAGEEDSDQLEGNTGDDLLQGGKGNDFLDGGEGNDSLQGAADNDWLVGGAGNDVINGGDGQDAMRGDSGADIFVIEKPASIPDLILDFNPSEGDRLVLDKTGFNTDKLTADFKFLGGYLYYKEEKIALLQKDGETYNYFADLSEVVEFADTTNLASVPVTATNTKNNQAIPTSRSFIPQQTRSATATGENMLEDILQRGYLKVGVIPGRAGFTLEENGEWSGYGVDWARGLSVALFGNPDQVEFVASETTTFREIIDKVAAKEVDIVTTNLNPYLTWDASLGVDFSPTTIYDSRSLMVRKGEGIDTLSDLHGKKIALTSNTPGAQAFQDYMAKNNIEFQPVFFNTINETFEAYFNGLVDAIPAERTSLIGRVRQQSNLGEHLILDEELSKDPISLVLPENESAWADVVRWVTHAPVQAEEFGINSQNIEEFKTSNDPAIRRFLGLEGELGATLGLTNPNFAEDVIKTVGNYGEMFDRHFSDVRRNRNEIWTNEGLLYSPPFAGTVNNPVPFVDNDQRDLLQDVLKRGTVKVGVSGTNPGFSLNNAEEWSGIDVDLGRALAAALFGDPEQIEFVKQANLPTALVNVANGEVDLSAMGATQNLVRDAGMQVDFGPTYLYTGQGILVKKDSGITSLPMLNGRKIGILSGTTAEQNLSDALIRTGGDFIPVEYATGAELLDAYDKGEIDAISRDIAILNGDLSRLKEPSEHRLLDEILSKEPMSLIIDENQSAWGDVVRWVNYALMQAEEWGITQENVDDFVTNSDDPQIQRFLGVKDNLGEQLGLPNDYAYQIIKAVGNYAEVYGRNFSTDIMRRASNETYNNAGLFYSPPLGSTVSGSNITPPDNTDNNAGAVGDVDDTDDQLSDKSTDQPTDPNTPNQPGDNTDVNTPDNDNFLVNQLPANRLPLPEVDNPLGYQVLLSTDQTDVLTNANATNDLILAFRGNDIINGGAGNDVIYAGKDDDLVSGGSSDDIIYGDNGDDTIAGNDGNDWLNGNRDNDIVTGDAGNDTVDGGKGDDTVDGGLGDDTVYGGEGNDLMLGGDGNDLLITDQGDDTLTGGLGNDLFALTDQPGINLITDFTTSQDKFLLTSNISFSQLTFTNITGGASINLGDRSLAVITGINAQQITVNDFQSTI